MRKTHVKANDPDIDYRFASKIKLLVDLISPKDLYLIAGRATAKTSDIVAERSMAIAEDMPRSYQLFVSDTYVNALTNVQPALIEGWQRKGWREGIHYVTDKRPPGHFKLPYKPPLSYKHTISIYNGVFYNLGSLDQPSGLAGSSYQHRYGDEARLLKKKKLDRSTPALRGEYAAFGHSVFYMGNTFTTDMPNILLKDDDWILQMEKEMDQEQIELALQAALKLNEVKLEIISRKQAGDFSQMKRLQRSLAEWTKYWTMARKDSVFFYAVSSLVNVDILTDGYFTSNIKALGYEEFRSAILSFRVMVSQGEKFYPNLEEHHFYDDGTLISYFDRFAITDSIEDSSLSLKYIDHNQKIEAGVDFGDMCSMVSGQHRGNSLYALKEFYTLPPQNEDDLGEKFREFYKHHKVKVLDLYYDRSGNQNQKVKRDRAGFLKNAIEYDKAGSSTGWVVNLQSLNQSTIYQEEEYNFAKVMMSGTNDRLPKLLIDKYKCKCLKSSLELAKIVVKTDKNGSRSIHKDKSSEKLPMPSRPMYSTNFSDAFKYWIYRKIWTEHVSYGQTYSGMDPSFH